MCNLHLCKGGVIMNRSDRERYEEEKRQQQYGSVAKLNL